MGRRLLKLGLMTDIDAPAFAAYCIAWGRWTEAEEKLRTLGAIVKAPSGYPIQNPYLAVENKAIEQMKVFLTEFGMTPSSRSRVIVSDEEAGDTTEEFLFGDRRRA